MDQPPVTPTEAPQTAPQPVKANNTLRNVLVGCLGVFIVLLLVGGFITYRFVVRPIQNVAASVEQLTDLGALNARIQASDFAIPEDGILTEAQLARFLQVQSTVKTRMAGQFGALQAQLQKLEGQDLNLNSLRQIVSSAKELPALLRQAKEAQVAALNEQGFSLKEYEWVKREAIRAVGASFQSIDFSQFLGDGVDLPEVVMNVPEANQQLLAPYRERIDEVMGLALFGL